MVQPPGPVAKDLDRGVTGPPIDIFISYAHLDDRPAIEGEKGWVSKFHYTLETLVSQILGRRVRIWRDPKLAGNDLLTPGIETRIDNATTLVCVVSPRYVQSEWCLKELSLFAPKLPDSGPSPVFEVYKRPVDDEPPELADLTGYRFYTQDDASGDIKEMRPSFGAERLKKYLVTLEQLASDIAAFLEGPSKDDVPTGKAIVYLAETSFDLTQQRQAIRAELRNFGHTVLPSRPLPAVGDELEARIRTCLAESDLTVHLLGQNYALIPESRETSIAEIQLDLATGPEYPRLPGVVWIPAECEPSDPRQESLLERVRGDRQIQQRADVLDGQLLEDLKTAIHRHLTPGRRATEKPAETLATTVYLIQDLDDDGDAVSRLQKYMFGRGYEVVRSVFLSDEQETRLGHEESMATSDAVLVYWGVGSEVWCRRKLRELRKALGQGRRGPFLGKAIWVAPGDETRAGFKTQDALVLEPAEEDPSELELFLQLIERAKANTG